MIVKVKKHHLSYFRKKALKSPDEIYACLIGTRVSNHVIQIEYFKYPELEEQSPNEVVADDHSFGLIVEDAQAYGFSLVGAIHSHPNWTPELSKCDLDNHKDNGFYVTGVVAVLSNKTFVKFWLADSPLPATIEYY